jgi:hypothetical protein
MIVLGVIENDLRIKQSCYMLCLWVCNLVCYRDGGKENDGACLRVGWRMAKVAADNLGRMVRNKDGQSREDLTNGTRRTGAKCL